MNDWIHYQASMLSEKKKIQILPTRNTILYLIFEAEVL